MSRAPVWRTVALAVTLASGAGCLGGWRREYPREWPERVLQSGGSCLPFSGSWENLPEEDPFNLRPRSLEELLLGQAIPKPKRLRVLVESTPAGDLRVGTTPLAGGEPSWTELRKGRDFECADGSIVVHPAGGPWADADICVGRTWKRATLARDASGALVVRPSERVLCISLLGAACLWEADWARFRPVSP
jgi:hypothetical protein